MAAFRGIRQPGEHAAAALALRAAFRAHFRLGDGAVITVAQLQCRTPGCPPVETLVNFWDADGQPYRMRFFQPLAEVQATDLPPRWLLPALRDDGDGACC